MDELNLIKRYEVMKKFVAYGSIDYIEIEIGIALTYVHLDGAKGDPTQYLMKSIECRQYQKGLEKKLCINFGKVLK